MHEIISKLIYKHVTSVNTVEVRNSDSLDFHEVHITALKELVREAILLGVEISADYTKGSVH
jgi:hypothetical protein